MSMERAAWQLFGSTYQECCPLDVHGEGTMAVIWVHIPSGNTTILNWIESHAALNSIDVENGILFSMMSKIIVQHCQKFAS